MKKEKEKKDESEEMSQISFFQEEQKDPTQKLEVSQGELVLLNNKEVYQPPIPVDVLKNRSRLMDDVMHTEILMNLEAEALVAESSEKLSQFPLNVSTRFSVWYEEYSELNIEMSEKLTQFDREVIDAVATLAPHTHIISDASIHRVIAGKDKGSSVSKQQKEKVANSMKKCGRCRISIDVTDEVKNSPNFGPTDTLSFKGYLISYEEFEHNTPHGANSFYHILSMPPLFRFAESLGKISAVPLHLLDTPVNKNDGNLAIQSYLLRSIEEMKERKKRETHLEWMAIYTYAEVPKSSRTQTTRARTTAEKILQDWVEKRYISAFESRTDSSNRKITALIIYNV